MVTTARSGGVEVARSCRRQPCKAREEEPREDLSRDLLGRGCRSGWTSGQPNMSGLATDIVRGGFLGNSKPLDGDPRARIWGLARVVGIGGMDELEGDFGGVWLQIWRGGDPREWEALSP